MKEFLICEWGFLKKLVKWLIIIALCGLVTMPISAGYFFLFIMFDIFIITAYLVYFILMSGYLAVKIFFYGFGGYECKEVHLRLSNWLSGLAVLFK